MTTTLPLFLSVTTDPEAEADCPTNGGLQIALGIISLLLALSEALALSRKSKASGIIQAVQGVFGKRQAAAPDSSSHELTPLSPVDAAVERKASVNESFTTAPE